MKKVVLFLSILGFASLIVGSVLVSPSVQKGIHELIIHATGTIVQDTDESQSAVPNPETSNSTQLNQIGFLTILLGAGLLSVGFLSNRKRN